MTQGEAIILRILATSDHHAYELDKLFDQNRMRDWADIGFSSIYGSLNKLEKRKLVRSRMAPEQAGPARRVYAITPEGRAEVRKEIPRLVAGDPEPRDAVTVGIILSSLLGEREFEGALARRREVLAGILERIPEEPPAGAKGVERIRLAFQRLRVLVEAELDWLDGVTGSAAR